MISHASLLPQMNRPIRIKIHVSRHQCTKVRGEHPHSLQSSILQHLCAQAIVLLSDLCPVSRPWPCFPSISFSTLLLRLSSALLLGDLELSSAHRAPTADHATVTASPLPRPILKYPLPYVQDVRSPPRQELFFSQCFELVDPSLQHQHPSLSVSGIGRHNT